MAFALTRGAAVASAFGVLVSLWGGAPALAQTAQTAQTARSAQAASALSLFAAGLPTAQGPGSREARATSVRNRLAALIAAVRGGVLTADQARAAIRNLIVANPAVAGEIVAAIIAVSKEGVGGVRPNLSLTQLLADGVALGVRELQLVSATNPAAQAALQAINQTFVDEGVSRGSAFGAQFAVTLNAAGGTLIPPQLAPETSPIAVVIPTLPPDTTNEISPT